MKKSYIVLGIAFCCVLAAYGQTKFDPRSLSAVNYYKQLVAHPGIEIGAPYGLDFNAATVSRSAATVVDAIVKLNDGYDASDLVKAGLTVQTAVSDKLYIVYGDMADIAALETNPAVMSVSLSAPLEPTLDRARLKSGVNEIHNGTDIDYKYTGKGVVCGIHDIGVDPNHINFYNTDMTESRVRELHHFVSSRIIESYTTPAEIAAFTTDDYMDSHGAHTAGCMAGAFRMPGNRPGNYPQGVSSILDSSDSFVSVNPGDPCPYYGPAFNADIFMTCGNYTTTSFITAVSKAIDYAKAHNQPCVFNISFSSTNGSHDGSDMFGEAVEELGKQAIICMSAGNEGENNLSIVKTLTEADKTLKTTLGLSKSSMGVLDIYGSDTNNFVLGVAVIDLNTGAVLVKKDYVDEGSYMFSSTDYPGYQFEHDPNFDAAFSQSYIYISISDNQWTTGRHGITITYTLTNNASTNSNGRYVLGLIVEGQAGQRIDIVNTTNDRARLTSSGLPGYLDGTPDLSINTIACNDKVISVGSWTSRVQWPLLIQSTMGYESTDHLDNVSPFSSYGTLYDGRQLPDVCAPGAGIISSINSFTDQSGSDIFTTSRYKYNGRYYEWAHMQGTSMASPFCAGVIATWLEADPTLTVEKVRAIIRKTSDPLKGRPGQGSARKLNAYAGLKEVLASRGEGGVDNVTTDSSDIMLRNLGSNIYEVFVPGGNVSVTVYNLNGQPVKKEGTADNTLNVDMNGLSAGIYLLNINNRETYRVAVR